MTLFEQTNLIYVLQLFLQILLISWGVGSSPAMEIQVYVVFISLVGRQKSHLRWLFQAQNYYQLNYKILPWVVKTGLCFQPAKYQGS